MLTDISRNQDTFRVQSPERISPWNRPSHRLGSVRHNYFDPHFFVLAALRQHFFARERDLLRRFKS